jgi:hypothetical protein
MSPTRLAPVLVGLVVLVAGCTGTLAEVRAAPATIPEAALTPVGYVHGNTTEVPLTYPVSVGPVTRNVTAYLWLSGYSRTVANDAGGNDTAGLLVVSSPNERVEGQSVNPFVHLSNRELVAELLDLVVEAGTATGRNVTDVASLGETGVSERTVLGRAVAVVTYTATVEVAAATPADPTRETPPAPGVTSPAVTGSETLFVHLMVVEHGDDVVIALGVHGDAMDEAATMADLMERIEHDGTTAV